MTTQTRKCATTLQEQYPWRGHKIGDSWVKSSSGEEKECYNPNDGSPLFTFYLERGTIQDAILSAKNFLASADDLSLNSRFSTIEELSNLLQDYYDDLKQGQIIGNGKNSIEADDEVNVVRAMLDITLNHRELFVKQLQNEGPSIEGRHRTSLSPRGISAVYLPAINGVTTYIAHLISAIMSRSPVVFFSDLQNTLLGNILTTMQEKTQAPRGQVHFIYSGFDAFKEVFKDNRVTDIFFSGSITNANLLRKNHQSTSPQRLHLSTDGINSAIVHSSSDIETACPSILNGCMLSTGQNRLSLSRIFIYRSLYDQFVDRLCQTMTSITPSLQDGSQLQSRSFSNGPLLSKIAVKKFLQFQTMANRESSETLCWAKPLDEVNDGFFVTPGVHYFNEFDKKSIYQTNHSYGPKILLFKYDVLDEAISHTGVGELGPFTSFFGDSHVLENRENMFQSETLTLNQSASQFLFYEAHSQKASAMIYRFLLDLTRIKSREITFIGN